MSKLEKLGKEILKRCNDTDSGVIMEIMGERGKGMVHSIIKIGGARK